MLGKRLGIDLGTTNSLVWLAGKGIVLNEPTVVAISPDDGRLIAVGNEAKLMLGKTPGNIEAVRPLRDGVIADYAVTEALLRYFIQTACGRAWFFKPEVMICIPGGVTQVEKRAVLDATLSAGARVAYLIDEALAAAIGAKIPIASASGNMIVDMGGGACEAAVISLGGVVVHKSVRMAGNKIDEAIAGHLRKKYNIIIGEQTAEEIKIKIGSALALNKEETHEVKGRDSVLGLPKLVTVSSTEVTTAIKPILAQIIGTIKSVLEETPPELASDIVDKGIVLSGGTSQLRNLDKLMTQELGVPCHVVEDPLLSVVKGTGIALENIDLYRRSITSR
ncbi:MAG: Rod shape-determining protein MreB [Microgenomates group bacterium ADurb.Bin219]|nr:MAG: Rod shape-determining protein MreB [Microgenomates group bacterium ADurb.Bin219]